MNTSKLSSDLVGRMVELEEYAARPALKIRRPHTVGSKLDPVFGIAAELIDAKSLNAAVQLIGRFKNEARRISHHA